MARKTKRRVFRRPRPQQRTEDAAHKQQRLEAAANTLLNAMSDQQIGEELTAREAELAEADRVAQLDPSPDNLSRYRYARSQFEAAQYANRMVNGRVRSGDDA